jgi:hypothetical protein
LELYETAWHLFVANQPKLEASWLDLGLKLVERGSWWVRHYYFVVEARAGREADLDKVQGAMQRLTRLFQHHPGYLESKGDRVLVPLMVKHGAFWAETPEQAVTAYRAIMDAGMWGDGRRRFVNADRVESGFRQLRKNKPVDVSQFQLTPADGCGPANPPIPGWSWADRLRAEQLWAGFVEELCNCTNTLSLLEGHYLRCAAAPSSAAFEQEWTALAGAVEAQMDLLLTKQALDTWEADLQWLLASRVEALEEGQRKRVVDEIWSAFQRRKSETSKQPPTRARTPAIITRAQTTQVPTPSRPPSMPSSSAGQPVEDAGLPMHHTLEVKRFWEIPVRPVTDATVSDAPEIAAWCFREGRLWLDMRYAPPSSTREVHLAGVDLETLQAIHVQLDIEQFNLPFLAPSYPQERVFEVKGDDLYLGLNDGLRRYSLLRKTWSRVPLPVEGQVRPFRLGDRLILTGQESILELLPDDSARILASCRRRPPQSILDELPAFGRPVPSVFLLENQTMGTFLGGKLYRRGPNDADWVSAPFASFDTRGWQMTSSENVLFLTRTSPQGGSLQAIHGSASSPELLLEWNATSRVGAMRPRMPSTTSPNTPAPRWKLPPGVAGRPFVPHLAEGVLWTFAGPLEFESDGVKGVQMRSGSPADAFLLRFDPGGVSPLIMALDFQFRLSAPARDSVAAMLRKPGWTARLSLHHGPAGVCLTQTGVPGFWHLPADELARGVTSALQQRGGNKSP